MAVTFLGNDSIKFNKNKTIIMDGFYTTSDESEINYLRELRFEEKPIEKVIEEPKVIKEAKPIEDPLELLKKEADSLGIPYRNDIKIKTLTKKIKQFKGGNNASSN
jgi:hypothetical protein